MLNDVDSESDHHPATVHEKFSMSNVRARCGTQTTSLLFSSLSSSLRFTTSQFHAVKIIIHQHVPHSIASSTSSVAQRRNHNSKIFRKFLPKTFFYLFFAQSIRLLKHGHRWFGSHPTRNIFPAASERF